MRTSSTALVVSMVAGLTLATTSFGADDQGQYRNKDGTVRITDRYGAYDLATASDLIGKEVRNTQNDSLGKVSDLIVSLDSGRVPYAIISHGGALGVGRTKTAVPVADLQYSGDRKHVMLSATKEELKAASKSCPANWPHGRSDEWARSIDGFYGQPNTVARWSFERDRLESTPDGRYVRDVNDKNGTVRYNSRDGSIFGQTNEFATASEFIGKEVRNASDESLGKVSDLIVSLDSGRVPYAIIAHGGALGVGRTKTAVPINELQCSGDHKTVLLSATKEDLKAASKTCPDNWPRGRNTEWSHNVDGFYGQPSAFASWRFEREPFDGTVERKEYVRDPNEKGATRLMKPADVELYRRLSTTLRTDATPEPTDGYKITVEDGVVTLRGRVDTEAEKQDLESKARTVPGVQRVDNQLTVRSK
jgi:sporulation protein YlmC with PRC-barrel domain